MMIKIMKMVTRPILFLLVITFFTTSCSPKVIQKTDKEKAEITITDVVGREVKLTTPVRGIIGTHTPSLDTAIVLGGGGKYLIGCGYKDKTRNLYNLIMDYDKIVQIGQGKSVNLETIKTLGENIVAILPERSLDQTVVYESIGVPAVVALPNTESFETVKNSLLLVGKILGEEARAEKINTFIDRQILRAQEITTYEPKKPSVLFLGGSSFLSVAPAAMIQSQLIEIAGGINAAKELDHKGGFAEVNMEQIIAWDPEVIWIPAYAKYTVEELLRNETWSTIKAIKNKAVYIFPSSLEPWDYPTPAISLGILWATYNLHPQAITKDEIKQKIDEYYHLVYGKTFSLEQIGIR